MAAPFTKTMALLDELIGQMQGGLLPITAAPAAAASAPKVPASTPAKTAKASPAVEKKAPVDKKAPADKAPADKADGAAERDGKAEKAAKAEKKKAAAAAAEKKAPSAEDRAVDVSWSDIRVGVILEAKPHPESDKLYVETIDLGEAAPRTVLSGLAAHMTLEQVIGARVVCICNLTPRKMAGIESQAMVLCASDAAKSALAFVTPPAASAPGERVTFEGYPGEPEAHKKMGKKKAWEAIQPEFSTDAQTGLACYKGVPFGLAAGPCTTPIKGGVIS